MQFRHKSLFVAAALAFIGTAANAETVKIAIAGPFSGSVAQYGDMVKAGALTAIEQINAAGGANGNKLEAVMMDDACEPKQAVAVANKIVSQKIKYVIGHVCSGSTIPASDIYENEGVVMITPSATAPQPITRATFPVRSSTSASSSVITTVRMLGSGHIFLKFFLSIHL